MATACGILFVICVFLMTVTCDICTNKDIVLKSLDVQKRTRNSAPLLASDEKINSWTGGINNEYEINSDLARNRRFNPNNFPIYPRQPGIVSGFNMMNNFDRKILPDLEQQIKNPDLFYWQPRKVDLTSRYQPLPKPKTDRWIERNSDRYNLPSAFARGSLNNFNTFPYFNQHILEQSRAAVPLNIDRNNVIHKDIKIDGLANENMKITQEIMPMMQSTSENKIYSLFDLVKQSPVIGSFDKNPITQEIMPTMQSASENKINSLFDLINHSPIIKGTDKNAITQEITPTMQSASENKIYYSLFDLVKQSPVIRSFDKNVITQETMSRMQSASKNKLYSLFDLIKQSPVIKNTDKNAIAIEKYFRKNMNDTSKDMVDENGNKHETGVSNTIANSTTENSSFFFDVSTYSSTPKRENNTESSTLYEIQNTVDQNSEDKRTLSSIETLGSSQLPRDKMVTKIDGLTNENMKISKDITPKAQSESENILYSLINLIKQSPVTKSIDKTAIDIEKYFMKIIDDTRQNNVDKNGYKHEASVLNTTGNSTTKKSSSFSDVMTPSSTTKNENRDSSILDETQDFVGQNNEGKSKLLYLIDTGLCKDQPNCLNLNLNIMKQALIEIKKLILSKFESDDIVVQAIEKLIQTIREESVNKESIYSRQNEKSTSETKIIKLDFNPANKAVDLMKIS